MTNGLVVYSNPLDLDGFALLDNTGYFWKFKSDNVGDQSRLELIYGPIVGFRTISQSVEYTASTDDGFQSTYTL